MRWPSVYFWGWFMVPGRLLIFVGAFAIVIGVEVVARQFGWAIETPIWLWLASFAVLGLIGWMLIRCPRCGRDAYTRGGFWANNLWPVRTCTKCGLDLTRHHPFDAAAKRGD